MARIDDFKANLIGGGARPNQFRVTITPMYDETKSPLDLRVVPWTDDMSDW